MEKIRSIALILGSVLIVSLSGIGQSSEAYDESIRKITDKLQQYPGRTKDIPLLKENYDAAMKANLDRIHALLATGQPDIWAEIYQNYQQMDSRQKLIMSLPEATVSKAGIVMTDLDKAILESRYKATAYHYAHAEKLMGTGKPEAAMEAYRDLVLVAQLNSTYKELDKLIRKAVLIGATKMEFEMHNRTGKRISTTMIDHLTRVVWDFKKARYGQVWQNVAAEGMQFTLRVILTDLQVGQDQVRELQYQEERDMYQGEEVVDTLRCQIQEYRQLKKAQLTGAIEYYDHRLGQVINRVPLKVESIFTNSYAFLQGDPQAAGDETRKLLAAKQAAYPSDEQMMLDAAEEFAKKASEVILAE